MKNQFLNLGKALSKQEQKVIQGGLFAIPWSGCPLGYVEDECGMYCVAIGERYLAPC